MSLSATLIASPMPRVPPVTIATRAMSFLLIFESLGRLGRWNPACKFAHDQPLQHGDAFRGIVQAVEQRELLAAGVEEGLAAANAQLLEGFEAIGGETRRCNGHATDAAASVGRERGIGRRLQPFCPAEPRL